MMTQKQIQQSFLTAVAEQNTETNPFVPGTDWPIFGNAIGGTLSSAYQDIESLRQAIFTQYASGVFLDWEAFSCQLPARQGASFALVSAANTVVPGTPYFFQAGTIFTSAFNGYQYTLIADTTMSITSGVYTTFSLQSVQSGNGYQVAEGSSLSNTVHPDVSITVVSSTDGQVSEGDGQLRKRILNSRQDPTGAGRASDYEDWAIEGGGTSPTNGTNYIQGALVIPNFFTNNVIGVFTLSGTFNYNYVLINYPSDVTPYTLTTPPAPLFNASTYIDKQKPVQANTYIESVATYMVPNAITINVVLPAGYTLTTTVNNFNNEPISVENIIYQEFRRALISYDLGGTQLNSLNYLVLSQIEQVIDVGLSINGGIYQQILISRQVLVDGVAQDITVPPKTLDSNQNLICVYDILQSNVTINQVT